MEIHYCDGCAHRIPEGDLKTGDASVSDDGKALCASCLTALQEGAQNRAVQSGPSTGATYTGAPKAQLTVPRSPPPREPEPTPTGEDVGLQILEFEDEPPPVQPAQPERSPRAGKRSGPRTQRPRRRPSHAGATRAEPEEETGGSAGLLVVGFALVLAAVVGAALYFPRDKKPRGKSGDAAGKIAKVPDEKPPAPAPDESDEGDDEGGDGEDPRLAAAKEVFERIRALVEEGDLDGAEGLLAERRTSMLGTDCEPDATRLIRDSRARKRLDAARRLFDGKQYDEAQEEALDALREAPEAECADELTQLAEKIRKAMEEEKRLAGEERKARQDLEAFNRKLDPAKRRAEAGDYDAALKLLKNARALAYREDLVAQADELRFEWLVARGRGLAEKGKLVPAVASYGQALEIRDVQEVKDAVERLEKLRLFIEFRTQGKKALRRGDWKAAIENLVEAKRLAADEEATADVEALLVDARFGRELNEARGHLRAGRWRASIACAKRALGHKAGDAQALRVIEQARKGLLPETLKDSVGIRFVLVRAGTFTMGSNDGAADEQPVHEAGLNAYYVSVTEVTNAQYEAFDPKHRRARGRRAKGDNHPVTNVSYDDALAFCAWLSAKEEVTCDLPTEAEWEYAARGPDARTYPWGGEPPGGRGAYRCNFGMRARKGWGRDGFVYAAPVGSFRKWASPFGCLDMAGNASEWCLDWYDSDYYARSPAADPAGPDEEGLLRVIRGGSWKSDARAVRSSARSGANPETTSPTIGFRVVREAEVPSR